MKTKTSDLEDEQNKVQNPIYFPTNSFFKKTKYIFTIFVNCKEIRTVTILPINSLHNKDSERSQEAGMINPSLESENSIQILLLGLTMIF